MPMMPIRILVGLLVLFATTAAGGSGQGPSSLLLDPDQGTVGTAVTASTANFACQDEAVPVSVPNLVGDTADQAKAELDAAGLALRSTSGEGPLVTSQVPVAETEV